MIVVYAPRALRDLEDISSYLTDSSDSNRYDWCCSCKHNNIKRLSTNRPRRRRTTAPPPACLRYPYMIFYRIDGDEIIILHIRHTSRQPIDPATDL